MLIKTIFDIEQNNYKYIAYFIMKPKYIYCERSK